MDPDNQGAFYYLSLVKQAIYGREEHNRAAHAGDALVEIAKAWSPKVGIGLPVPNPYVTNTDIHTGVGREVIYRKLNNIRLDNIPWADGLPLSEVIRWLNEQAKARDPEKKGVNFIFNPNVEAPSVASTGGGGPGGQGAFPGGQGAFPGAAPVPGQINPATGLPEAARGKRRRHFRGSQHHQRQAAIE